MTPDQFLTRCKSLWHIAPAGAWDQIAKHGLLTAQQLIDQADLDDEAKATLSTEPRREAVAVEVNGESIALRDQGSLYSPKDPDTVLDAGIGTENWIRTLNQRVYLFTDKAPMTTMLERYVERDGAQDVLLISPMRLLESARGRIELTRQNTGAMSRRASAKRADDTFTPMLMFPDRKPSEVTVVDGIEDLSVIVRAERHHRDGTREPLGR